MKSAMLVKCSSMFLMLLLVLLGGSDAAYADLVYDSSLLISGTGFGAIPRHLTIHPSGGDPTQTPPGSESGCVSWNGSTLVVGQAACAGSTVWGADAPEGGNEPNPHSDANKYGAPTLGSLGITTLSQLVIVFNPSQTSAGAITLDILGLKFFAPDGTLITTARTISGDPNNSFPSSDPGNGSAGFAYVLTAAQVTSLEAALIGYTFANIRMALDAELHPENDGQESFFIAKIGDVVVPEPASILSLGTVLFGIGHLIRRRMKRA